MSQIHSITLGPVRDGDCPVWHEHLPDGCYRLTWQPEGTGAPAFYGTARIHRDGSDVHASGDLYAAPEVSLPRACPDDGSAIPIYPVALYEHYIQITELRSGGCAEAGIAITFSRHKKTSCYPYWKADGEFSGRLDLLEGALAHLHGVVVETPASGGSERISLALEWVSGWLRRAVVKIGCEYGIVPPALSTPGPDWASIGLGIGWALTAEVSPQSIERVGKSDLWQASDCHQAMERWQLEAQDDGSGWAYYLLCVAQLPMNSPGLMFDSKWLDRNLVPREGAAVAASWVFPTDTCWGALSGRELSAVPPSYLRCAAHEIGHAMGLDHDLTGLRFMAPCEQIARLASDRVPPYPASVDWRFSTPDELSLRHAPDWCLRPGGKPLLSHDDDFLTTDRPCSDGLALVATPELDAVPLGAPVRVNLKLIVTSKTPIRVPKDIGLSGGCLRGWVFGVDGPVHEFRPLVSYAATPSMVERADSGSVESSITLLHGSDGALFPTPGRYWIRVQLRWRVGPEPLEGLAEGLVTITPAAQKIHETAAMEVLKTPDATLTLVLGGDHLQEGNRAIQAALKNSVLRPHFAWIEAKRLAARPSADRSALLAAASLINVRTILSQQERDKVESMLKTNLSRLQWWRIQRFLRRQQPETRLGAALNLAFDALLSLIIAIARRAF